MDAARDSEAAAAAAAASEAEEVERKEQEEEEEDENEILIAKAQVLIEKITSNPENPNPNALHALSTILEAQESRYKLCFSLYNI